MTTGLTNRFREVQERQELIVSRSVELDRLEADARRHAQEAARLHNRCQELGLDKAAEWYSTSFAAAQGARTALREEKP